MWATNLWATNPSCVSGMKAKGEVEGETCIRFLCALSAFLPVFLRKTSFSQWWFVNVFEFICLLPLSTVESCGWSQWVQKGEKPETQNSLDFTKSYQLGRGKRLSIFLLKERLQKWSLNASHKVGAGAESLPCLIEAISGKSWDHMPF